MRKVSITCIFLLFSWILFVSLLPNITDDRVYREEAYVEDSITDLCILITQGSDISSLKKIIAQMNSKHLQEAPKYHIDYYISKGKIIFRATPKVKSKYRRPIWERVVFLNFSLHKWASFITDPDQCYVPVRVQNTSE